MKSVLIIVTSANKRDSFGVKTYNEQEIGLSRALCKKGYRCGIVFYGNNIEKQEIIKIGDYTVKMYLFKGHDFFKTAVFKNYDSVYAQYDILMPITYDHYESYHIATKYPDKTVVYHGTYYSPFNKGYNIKCKFADKLFLPGYKKHNTLFATKNTLAANFLNSKGLNNTHVIGVGLDADQMASKEMKVSDVSEKIKEYRALGFKVLLYIGRIEQRRNTLFLLDVFNQVKKSEKVKLIIIGNGNSSYKMKCRQKALSNNLMNDILYVDRLEQNYLPMVYSLSDLFLLPTSYEIFGMVLLEAMYFKTPVLTTLNGGSDILINNRGSGYIIPELDVNQWANKVCEILHVDNNELTNTAHKIIAEEFVWDVLADKFIKCFNIKLKQSNGQSRFKE